MKYSTYYNLKKPDGNDNAKISDINENMDILDEEIAKKANKQSSLQKWNESAIYDAQSMCYHKGEIWTNTSGDSAQGVEPGTNYNIWNVGYSNPNLLDNPWFTVNQRGWTSGTPSGTDVYTVDRWKINSDTTLVKEDNGITITVGNSIDCLYQFLNMDLVKQIAGKVCTISVMLQTGEVFSKTITPPEDYNTYWDTPEIRIGYFNFDIYGSPNLYGYVNIRMFNDVPGETISIRAVKIELGPVSTLANDSEPDYATELLKCQRYYQQMSLSDGRLIVSNIRDSIQFSAKITPHMRAVPSVSLLSTSFDVHDNKINNKFSTTSASIGGLDINNHSISYLNISGFEFTEDQLNRILVGRGNNIIELSADL